MTSWSVNSTKRKEITINKPYAVLKGRPRDAVSRVLRKVSRELTYVEKPVA